MTEATENKERAEMICVRELSHYEEDRPLLSDLTFSIEKGGIHGILGPRGAGKSALMRLLSGSAVCASGSVMVNGLDLSEHAKEGKRKIGYVPQTPVYYKNMTVIEVLDLIGDARGVSTVKRYRQIKEAMELLNLDGVQNRLTQRLTPSETKRLSLAGALLGNPDVILVDEPILGNDGPQRDELYGVIRMLGGIKTVVVASANYKAIRDLCEDVIILSDGKILVKGSFDELEAKLLRNRVLYYQTRGDAHAITSAIGSLAGVIDCTFEPARGGELDLRVEYRAEADPRGEIAAVLSDLGAPVLSLTTKAMSLETVYRSLLAASAMSEKEEEGASLKTQKERKGGKEKMK